MSIVAIKITNNDITIAGDSQTSWGNHKFPKVDTSDQHVQAYGKIWQTNGMTIGCAGACAHIGLLQIFSKSHKPKDATRDAIIDWVIEFKEYCNAKAKIAFNDISVHGIIVIDRLAFSFFDFIDANQITDFDAVGSGMWLALGAMEVGASAEDAVGVACKYDKGCSGLITKIIIKK